MPTTGLVISRPAPSTEDSAPLQAPSTGDSNESKLEEEMPADLKLGTGLRDLTIRYLKKKPASKIATALKG